MKVKNFRVEIEIPEGVSVELKDGTLAIKGEKGEVTREFIDPIIKLSKEDSKIVISAPVATKREKKKANTFAAHIRNMIRGTTDGHKYVLKICSGHFPMNVSVSGNEFIVKNLLGEKYPRKLKIRENVKVSVQGSEVIVESVYKEAAGQTAADIERLTRRPGYDKRIFQDGIYIINKDGKEIK